MCDADSIIRLIEALPMARSKRQLVRILVLLCLIKDDGSSQTGSPRVRVPVRFSCMDNAQDENDNVLAIFFRCNRLRLYNTCRRMG